MTKAHTLFVVKDSFVCMFCAIALDASSNESLPKGDNLFVAGGTLFIKFIKIFNIYDDIGVFIKLWHANFISIKANKANKGPGPQAKHLGGNRS